MSNRFYFDDDSSSASSTDLSSLPYPKPLTRASFLVPDFDPATFLSSLRNRHQTLEDLRSELRQRSTDLNKELLDLVNSNYEDFLRLGRDLRGGDEKVEEVRVGMLGFKRELEGLKQMVKERRVEVERLLEERRGIRQQIVLGRGLLEVERRVQSLEGRLMLAPKKADGEDGKDNRDGEDSDSEEESDEDVECGIELGKLRRDAEQYIYITKLVARLGPEHPFLVKQEERILRLKQTVLLDLSSALKQAVAANEDGEKATMHILGIYKMMDESKEAVNIVKEARRSRK
ncbi:MAG: hypothetical protein Q9217_004808 [Psora testacea]